MEETTAFSGFLRRLQSDLNLGPQDQAKLKKLAVNTRLRKEVPIPFGVKFKKEMLSQFLATGLAGHHVPCHSSLSSGLRAFGWAALNMELGSGAFGAVQLAYKVQEQAVPLESRHLCAVKVQPKSRDDGLGPRPDHKLDLQPIHDEVAVLRGVSHPNIIDYYGFFAVTANNADPKFAMLLEYASAGDLEQEVERQELKYLTEPQARFYAHQIGSGIDYLHKKAVAHRDLHENNILLQFQSDGTKTCVICDFGMALIGNPRSVRHKDPEDTDWQMLQKRFATDVGRLCELTDLMLRGLDRAGLPIQKEDTLTKEAQVVVQRGLDAGTDDNTFTVKQLFRLLPWFTSSPTVPVTSPKDQLLHASDIQAIGYKESRSHSFGEFVKNRPTVVPKPVAKSLLSPSTQRQAAPTPPPRHKKKERPPSPASVISSGSSSDSSGKKGQTPVPPPRHRRNRPLDVPSVSPAPGKDAAAGKTSSGKPASGSGSEKKNRPPRPVTGVAPAPSVSRAQVPGGGKNASPTRVPEKSVSQAGSEKKSHSANKSFPSSNPDKSQRRK